MRRVFFLLLRLTSLPFLLREFVQRRRVSILCYHDPAPETLDSHLEWLTRHYNIIALKDYAEARRRGEMEKLPRKSLIVTLDDGHRRNYLLRDVIRKHGVPLTIFLCCDIVGTFRHYWWTVSTDRKYIRYVKDLPHTQRLVLLRKKNGFDEMREYAERQALSRDEIIGLSRLELVDFQSHTRFHPSLPRTSFEKAKDEVAGSKTRLEQDYGLNIYAFAYPGGDYSDREVELVEESGYHCALTIDGGWNGAKTPLFRLRRLRVDDGADSHELVVKASGLWDLVSRALRNRTYGYVRWDSAAAKAISRGSETDGSGSATVSVVIPTYNRADLLRRAIASVIRQTYENLEVIVVDDASPDGGMTGRVVASFGDPRLRYVRHTVNRGGAASRNTGIEAATGRYISFLDDDDEWAHDKTARQIRLLDEYDAVLCSSDEPTVRERGPRVAVAVNLYDLRKGRFTAGGTSVLMARAEVLRAVRFDEKLKRCQDWDLFIRIAQRFSIGRVAEPLVRYNEGSHERISNSIFNLAPPDIEKQLLILEKHREFFGALWYRRHLSRFLLYGIKHRSDKWLVVGYAMRRCGIDAVIWALGRRFRQKLRQPAFSMNVATGVT